VGRILIVVLLLLAVGAGWVWYAIHSPYRNFPSNGVFVDVPHGASSRAVSRLLRRNGVIRSAAAFEFYARRHPRRSLQAGEYFFDSAASAKEVFWKLANGEVFEQPFTVREGETMFDISRDLEAGKFMTGNEFLAAAKDPTLIRDLAPQATSLEGFLFPATYHLPRYPTAAALTADMVRKFKEEWSSVTMSGAAASAAAANAESTTGMVAPATGVGSAEGASATGTLALPLSAPTAAAAPAHATITSRTIISVVTLASLVERETPKAEERPLVAGVFENRLHKAMPLQCDPTVIYALEQRNAYKGTLTLTDLRIDSPYNTYTHTGLPPGPIGNPGEASLRAAYQPAHTDYLYFVANTQGGHFFSATLAEHNNNVIKYRRLLAEQAPTR
jgi:UPF0755 protein